ncbi:MAG: adenylate/guanylate cyclase domain-containing protein [Alphaproteobacteria bacterium]|nr:adenylate/guanylate cyclase domain-containing protein [Alphaproteobacteria bacterium]
MERRLAAILAADVVGYARLMRVDEAGTFERLKSLRKELVQPKIAAHKGRIVKLIGDGLLAEFPSVIEAVRCAVDIQQAMPGREPGMAEDSRIRLRIGVNLGDIIVERADIYGDGVNVAARLESLADPGGLCISGAVYEQVRDRTDVAFENRGARAVKNINRPIQVWHWPTNQKAAAGTSAPERALAMPDKPSIAVLPFENLSGDPEQDYFADGITEDIITALSKFRWFFVIARNSTFVYKGQAVDVKEVGRKLGVRYVLEGSVRRAASRVRISAQLIEAESGNHVWAERFDRSLEDIFDLQDEITSTIAAAVEPELAGSERERSKRKPTEHLDAWDLFQQGVSLMWQHNLADLNQGMRLIRQAIEFDPSFGRAYGHLAYCSLLLLVYEWADDRNEVLEQGLEDAGKALGIDQRDHFALHALGRLKTLQGEHQAAFRALESCVSINPNFALGYLGLAAAHVYGGDPKKAIDYAETAIRLSPNDPLKMVMLHYKGSAYMRLDEFDRAIEIFEKVCEFPTAQYVPAATLAALCFVQGRETEGRKALQQALRLEPTLSISRMRNVYGVSKDRPGTRTRRLLDALRRAGLPE